MKKPNRVQFQYLYFNPPLGGVENYFLAGSKYFRERGIRASVLASQNPGRPAPEREEIRELSVVRHPYFSPLAPLIIFKPSLYARWLESYLAREGKEIDLFISRHPAYVLATRRALPGRPVIFIPPDLRRRRLAQQAGGSWKERIIFAIFRPQIVRIERNALQAADRVITLSENLKRQLIEEHRIPAQRIEVLPPGVDTGRFSPGPADQDLLREFDLKEDDQIILTIGRLSPEKNLEFLLRAFARLKLPRAALVIVGDGGQLNRLERLARERGISDRTRFAGLREDPERFYRIARIFVLPSREEPFGQVYLEAMASGLPCLGLRNRPGLTRVATEEIITDGQDGFWVEPDAEDDLTAKMELLLNDDDLRRRLGSAARRSCLARYSWQSHFDNLLLNVYE